MELSLKLIPASPRYDWLAGEAWPGRCGGKPVRRSGGGGRNFGGKFGKNGAGNGGKEPRKAPEGSGRILGGGSEGRPGGVGAPTVSEGFRRVLRGILDGFCEVLEGFCGVLEGSWGVLWRLGAPLRDLLGFPEGFRGGSWGKFGGPEEIVGVFAWVWGSLI